MWRDAEGGAGGSTMRMEEALARGLQRQLLEEQQQRAVKQKAAQARKTIDMTWVTRVDFHKLASVKLYIIYYILLLCVHIYIYIHYILMSYMNIVMIRPGAACCPESSRGV